MDATIKPAFAVEAATIDLVEALKDKAPGDRITAAEVLERTGMTVRTLRHKLGRWAEAKRFVLFSVRGDGYRIGLPHEHVDFAIKKQRSAYKQERSCLRATVDADESQMTESQARKNAFVKVRAIDRVTQAERHKKETKNEFKLTERVPLRALQSGNG